MEFVFLLIVVLACIYAINIVTNVMEEERERYINGFYEVTKEFIKNFNYYKCVLDKNLDKQEILKKLKLKNNIINFGCFTNLEFLDSSDLRHKFIVIGEVILKYAERLIDEFDHDIYEYADYEMVLVILRNVRMYSLEFDENTNIDLEEEVKYLFSSI